MFCTWKGVIFPSGLNGDYCSNILCCIRVKFHYPLFERKSSTYCILDSLKVKDDLSETPPTWNIFCCHYLFSCLSAVKSSMTTWNYCFLRQASLPKKSVLNCPCVTICKLISVGSQIYCKITLSVQFLSFFLPSSLYISKYALPSSHLSNCFFL